MALVCVRGIANEMLAHAVGGERLMAAKRRVLKKRCKRLEYELKQARSLLHMVFSMAGHALHESQGGVEKGDAVLLDALDDARRYHIEDRPFREAWRRGEVDSPYRPGSPEDDSYQRAKAHTSN